MMSVKRFLSRRIDPRRAALILVATVAPATIVGSVIIVRTAPHHHAAAAGRVASSSPSGVALTPAPDGPSTPTLSASPATDNDSDDDDGGPAYTSTANPAGLAAAKTAGLRFAAAWLNTTNKTAAQWRADLAPMATDELNHLLADADPTSVPAGQIGDPVTVTADGDHLAIVTIPVVNAGTLTLTVAVDRPQKVTDIAWQATS